MPVACRATVEFEAQAGAVEDAVPMQPFVRRDGGERYVSATALMPVSLSVLDGGVHVASTFEPNLISGPTFARFIMGTAVAVAVVAVDSLLVHGCAMVSPQGRTWLFLGASGEGKTTMTRRLPGWRSLSDDTVLLEAPTDGHGPRVSGTVFSGRELTPRWGERHTLDHIAILSPHAPRVALEPVAEARGFSALCNRAFFPLVDGPLPAQVVDIAAQVADDVSCFELRSGLEHDVASILEAVGPGSAG